MYLFGGYDSQLELVSKFQFDLQGTVDWGKKLVVNFNSGKNWYVLFNYSNTSGSRSSVKMDCIIISWDIEIIVFPFLMGFGCL